MDPRRNPYAPGAGSKPPVLAGRDDQIEAFDVLLQRLENGYAEQSMIITGLRGVGKTVLLDVFREKAEDRGWVTIEWEVEKGASFKPKIAAQTRRILFQLDIKERWTDRLKRSAGILMSFTLTFKADGSVKVGLDEPLRGIGDSGNLSDDLSDLFVAIGEAAQEKGKGILFLLDEIQYLQKEELEALITALHKTTRRSLPITLVGAGLPQIPRLAGEAKSYSERLFKFPNIGELDPDTHARDALILPARQLGVEYTDDAMDFIIGYTQGYPYFLQEFGRIVWDETPSSPIYGEVAKKSLPLVEAKLDESFFRVRAERMTELELKYMFAMSELGPKAHRAAEVASLLKRSSEQVAPIRSRLIEKGLLYTPGYGLAAFTVPQFDRYMLRRHSYLRDS